MNKKLFTYKKSGVNIDAADSFINFISAVSSKKKGKKKFSNIGGFGSISNIPNHIKQPKIVACTDGVGTKIEIANVLNKYDTIGIDLVAMSVNDLIVQGAKPLLFLDYISINKIDLKKLKSIIKGIVNGCEQSECELVGGETAEMPGTYEKGKFDIAGFAVGVVDQKKILNKRKIKKNDLVLGIPSSGIHSNGYSLVRHLIKNKKINIKKNTFLKKELIKPTKIYVKEILSCDLRLEEEAIPALREGIALCEEKADFVSRQLLADILKNEEEHVDWLEEQFDLIKRMGLENYIHLRSGPTE